MDSPFSLPKLPALPALPAIGLTDFSTGLSVLGGVTSGVKEAAKDAALKAPVLMGLSISQVVSILVGLLFILGAVLSFKDSRDVVINAGKTAAKAAAVAA